MQRNHFIKSMVGVAAAALLASHSGFAFSQGTGKTELLWLGQASFKLTTPGGKIIIIDP